MADSVWLRQYVYICVGLLSCPSCGAYKVFSKRTIPIGGVFDEISLVNGMTSAFEFGIDKINEEHADSFPFNIDANVQRGVDVADSYSLINSACSKMKNGIFMLFSSTDVRTLSTIMSYANALHMPLFTANLPINGTNQYKDYTFFMRPLYTKAMAQYMESVSWRKVYYLYQNIEGLWHLQNLYDTLNELEMDIRLIVRRVKSAKDAYKQIKAIDQEDSSDEKKFILDIPTHMKDELFEDETLHTDPDRSKFHFLFAGLDVDEIKLTNYKNGGINITGFTIVNYAGSHVWKFLSEWNQLNPVAWRGAGPDSRLTFEAATTYDAVLVIKEALAKLSRKNHKMFENTLRSTGFFNNQTRGGIDCFSEKVVPWFYGRRLMKTIRETVTEGLTGRIEFDDYGLRKNYALDLWEVSLHSRPDMIALWNEIDGLRMKNDRSGGPRDKTKKPIANNRTRIVTSILTAPYLMEKKQEEGLPPLTGNDIYEGYCADLIKELAEKIGDFKYKIVPVKDKSYGSSTKNGTWNGMVGELIRHEADLAVAPLTITSARERVIDFSKPFMSLGISIMIKKPTKSAPAVFSFMYPLSYEIWMCVIFAYIGVSVVLFLVSRFSPFEWEVEENSDGPTATNKFTIFNSLWFSLGAFMQQGCDFEPRSVPGRIVGCVWWFFTLIMISSYTANLAAFLTVQRMQSPIESAEDLSRQTEIRYGTISSGSSQDFFRTSTFSVYQRMWAFMRTAEPTVFVGSNEEGLKMVRDYNGKYAFLTESTNIDYMNQQLPCDTMKVGSNLDSKGYGVATPLGSDIRDLITLAVLQLREEGVLQKLETKWWVTYGKCGEELSKSKDSTTALTLDNVGGCFYILGAGLLVALLISFLEFIYKSKIESRRRKTPFGEAMKTKAKLSLSGKLHTQTTSYSYAPAAQLISLDGFTDNNTHTQV